MHRDAGPTATFACLAPVWTGIRSEWPIPEHLLKVCRVSVIRPKLPEDPLLLSLPGAEAACRQEPVATRLEQVRRDLLETPGTDVDGSFLGQPERLLAGYGTTRSAARRADSELFAILSAARAIRDRVDRVVYVGGRGACACVEALFATCCHPFHNELSRGERGGRPRLTWLTETWDSDRMQGVLDLVAPSARAHRSDDLLDRWALVAAGAGETDSEAAMYHLLRGALRPTGASGASPVTEPVAEPIAVIPLPGSRLANAAADARHCFPLPEGVRGARAFFTAAGLLPASIVGLDVVRLLEGAASMQRRFREAPPAENPVLALAAAQPSPQVFLHAQDPRLSTVIAWYEALLAHGYEGVREIEAHVTNTFGWSATTGQVDPWIYQKISETYVLDADMRARMAELNTVATSRMAKRLLEASDRNYWTPDAATLRALRQADDELEDRLEGVSSAA